MHRSLVWKLILAFALVAFTSTVLVSGFIRLTSADRLTSLIVDQQISRLEQALTNYYSEQGSWSGVEEHWRLMQNQAEPTPLSPPENGFISRDRRSLFGLADSNGILVVSADRDSQVGARLTKAQLKEGTAIMVNGKQVGTLLVARRDLWFNPAENLFLQRTNQALALGALGALFVAMVIGALLAQTLTRPLQALTNAAQKIAQGQLEQQVEVTSQDEIGELALAFNRMSQEVARSNQMRRQMTADIAHDLRTPLTVIGGYVESMRDGVLQPTEQRLALIYTEIERLQRLVGDLRVLTQADAGELPLNPQSIAPVQILERAAQIYQHHAEQQQVTLTAQAPAELPNIRVDEARMLQVLDNLISNALRYTPPGGQITLGAHISPGGVTLSVRDTGSGIPPEELPLIFNRFHRADKSRHTETGQSGLGLAIVRALIEAQHGRVWAESREGAGTVVFMEMPG